MMLDRIARKWFLCPGVLPAAKLRLFCFPFAGGGASVYREWHGYLPAGIELQAVQLPGRETRFGEQLFVAVDELIAELRLVMLPLLDRPFAFFGHSMGGILAFELARALRESDQLLPQLLIVSGCRAPQVPRREPAISRLPLPEFIEALRKYAGTPDSILEHREVMDLLLPILRADFAMNEDYRYVPGEPLECPVRAYGGDADVDVLKEDLDAWQNVTAGEFRCETFPGGHFYFRGCKPLLKCLVGDLQRSLNGCGVENR
jgi:medium-chain acyl-[acyl-carrier-protein] hydrolase